MCVNNFKPTPQECAFKDIGTKCDAATVHNNLCINHYSILSIWLACGGSLLNKNTTYNYVRILKEHIEYLNLPDKVEFTEEFIAFLEVQFTELLQKYIKK